MCCSQRQVSLAVPTLPSSSCRSQDCGGSCPAPVPELGACLLFRVSLFQAPFSGRDSHFCFVRSFGKKVTVYVSSLKMGFGVI